MLATDSLSLARLATAQHIERGDVHFHQTEGSISAETIGVFDQVLAHVFQPNVKESISNRDTIASLLAERFEAERAINAKRQQFGGFGQPTSDFSTGRDGQGYFRHYQGGSIFWLPTWGAHEVHGAIRDKYASLGWEMSYLGYPTTDELGAEHSVQQLPAWLHRVDRQPGRLHPGVD